MKITVNPDKEYVKEIRQKLKDNKGYCPCRIQRTSKNKCICEEFRNQTVSGWCHCGLYYKQIEKGDNI